MARGRGSRAFGRGKKNKGGILSTAVDMAKKTGILSKAANMAGMPLVSKGLSMFGFGRGRRCKRRCGGALFNQSRR